MSWIFRVHYILFHHAFSTEKNVRRHIPGRHHTPAENDPPYTELFQTICENVMSPVNRTFAQVSVTPIFKTAERSIPMRSRHRAFTQHCTRAVSFTVGGEWLWWKMTRMLGNMYCIFCVLPAGYSCVVACHRE